MDLAAWFSGHCRFDLRRVADSDQISESLQQGGDGGPVLGSPLGVGERDRATGVYDEVSAELPSILASMKIGKLARGDHLGVAPDDAGMEICPEHRRAPEAECFVSRAVGVDHGCEGQREPVSQVTQVTRRLEGDDQHLRPFRFERLSLARHLHEMVFAEQSPDIAQEGKHDRCAAEISKPDPLAVQRDEGDVRSGPTGHLDGQRRRLCRQEDSSGRERRTKRSEGCRPKATAPTEGRLTTDEERIDDSGEDIRQDVQRARIGK